MQRMQPDASNGPSADTDGGLQGDGMAPDTSSWDATKVDASIPLCVKVNCV